MGGAENTIDNDFRYNLVTSLEKLHTLLVLKLLPEKEEVGGCEERGEVEEKRLRRDEGRRKGKLIGLEKVINKKLLL